MNCIDAQAAISAALDRAPVEATVIEEAKAHCKSCPDCGSFVRALAAAKRATLPEPPADLPDRIMVAIRAEAIAEQRAAAAHSTASAEPKPEPTPVPQPTGGTAALLSLVNRILAPENRTQLAIWGSSAAVLLVVAGMATVNGVHLITGGTPAATEQLAVETRDGYGAAPNTTPGTTYSPTTAGTEAAVGGMAATGPSFVTIGGAAYRLSGPASTTKNQLTRIGLVSTAMASGGTPTDRTVYVGANASPVFVEDDAGALYAFDAVVRTFRDVTYQQQSSSIPGFGVWPSLPSQISAPTSPDGSPTFVEVGQDDAGVKVYRLVASDASSGIGIAPGTSAGDPAGGNPNWTWWTPRR